MQNNDSTSKIHLCGLAVLAKPLIVALIVFTLGFGSVLATPALGSAQDETVDDSSQISSQHIFLIDAPFLDWDDIDPDKTPNLYYLIQNSGISNLVTRSTVRSDELVTPDEAAWSLAKGYWVSTPNGINLSDVFTTLTDNSGYPIGGNLGQYFKEAGWARIAIGSSNLGETPSYPAATSLVDLEGSIDKSYIDPDLVLVSNSEAPYGVQTNYEALENALNESLEQNASNNAIIAIDTGDLNRAGSARATNNSEENQAAYDMALANFDAFLEIILNKMEADDYLILYSTLTGTSNYQLSDDSYAVLAVYGDGYSSMLYSPSTGRDGTATVLDITATLYEIAGIDKIVDNGAALQTSQEYTSSSTEDLIEILDADSEYASAIDASLETMGYVFISVLAVSFLCSVIMLSTVIKLPVRVLDFLIPITRLLWLLTMSYPLATYLMGLFSFEGITPEYAIAICSITTFFLAIIAVLFGKFTKRWLYSLLLLMSATVIVIALDQLTGANLAHVGYLSYRPIDATRFSGIGNEGAAVLFGAWLLLSGLLVNRFDGLAITKAFRLWIFPICSSIIILIIVAPWWGANFGALVWGVVGTGATWWMFTGRRLTWKIVLLTVVICIGLTILLVLADGLLGTEMSHLGTTAANLLQNGLSYVPVIIANMFRLGVDTLLFNPFLSVALTFIWLYLAWLRIIKPGPYRIFWDRNLPFKAAFTSAMIVAVLMILFEDSGILLPALMLLYATAGFTWLICDLHRWELRAVEGDIDTEDQDMPVGNFKIQISKDRE